MKKAFPALALSMFSSTLGMGIVSPLLPIYAQTLGASGVWLGIIVASYSISNSIFVPFVGRMSDRKGRKVFLTAGLLAYAIISIGYVLAENTIQLSLVRFIQGIAGAATFPIAMAYLGDLAPEGEEGKWMGYGNAAFFSGFGIGPLLGGIMTENFGMNATFFTMGGLNLLAFFVAYFFLPEAKSRHADKEISLSYKEMSRSGMVRGIFSFRLAQALGRGGIFAFLPIFGSLIGLSISLIGVLITINFSSMILLAPIGGLIADRVNRRTVTIVGNIIFSGLLVAIPFSSNFSQLAAVLVIQGLSGALVMATSSALTVEEGRKYGMGSTMSMFMLAMGIGTAVGPIVSGVIADTINIDSVFYFGAIMGIVGTFLFGWFTRDYRG